MRTSSIGRTAAIAAVVIAGVAVAVIVLRGGGSNYTVKADFQNASQLVKGNLVQVSGEPVGKVTGITLTDNGQAEVTMKIDGDYAPLRQGTQATVRASSLSGIANRYVDLNLAPANASHIPSGGVIDASHTTTAVDLDQIFNIFDPKTRRSLTNVIRGSANQYTGKGAPANAGLAYLNPAIASTSALFSELNRDTGNFRHFITANSHLVTDVSQRASDLSALIANLATTTGAIGRQGDALQEAIHQLPSFMRRSNTTFVNLRATLDDLTPLVNESKPVAKRLRPFLHQLKPLAEDAQPTIRDLVKLIKKPGSNNDLIDLTKSNVPLRNVAIGPVQANGASRQGAFPAVTDALKASTPELASARPYAPDLLGWFDDFSHSGVYDALGGVSRAALYVNLFTLAGNATPNIPGGFIPPTERATNFAANAKLHQNNRCPGSMERDTGDGSINLQQFSAETGCDPSQTPLGP